MNWLDEVKWDAQGLVPAIAQEAATGDVLMFAWMNREALQKTAELGRAVYFSRSRGKLWFKGEESGHVQTVQDIRLDCDNDVVLLKVTQLGHGHEREYRVEVDREFDETFLVRMAQGVTILGVPTRPCGKDLRSRR